MTKTKNILKQTVQTFATLTKVWFVKDWAKFETLQTTVGAYTHENLSLFLQHLNRVQVSFWKTVQTLRHGQHWKNVFKSLSKKFLIGWALSLGIAGILLDIHYLFFNMAWVALLALGVFLGNNVLATPLTLVPPTLPIPSLIMLYPSSRRPSLLSLFKFFSEYFNFIIFLNLIFYQIIRINL